jgi:deoxyribose-phosphate aldolase
MAMQSNPDSVREMAACIDHTLLKPDATAADIERLCREAIQYGFLAVCVHGSWVRHACSVLQGADTRVVSVAGFPLGANPTEVKCFETETAVNDGAQEIDVVLNIGRRKQGDESYLFHELRDVVTAARGRTVKVILENCLLRDDEKIRACRLVADSGAQFVKTSTGFSAGGANLADIKLMRKAVGPGFGVKAAGGIRDSATARAMIAAGANRIGTSAGVAIVHYLQDRND